MTTPSQPLDDEQPPPAPRPGVRMRAPGAAPSLPAEGSESPSPAPAADPLQPSSPPATLEPAQPPTMVEKVRRARASRSGKGSAATSAADPKPTTNSSTASTDPDDPAPQLIEPGLLAEDLTEILQGASEAANDRWAPAGTPLYLADEREAAGVATPISSMITRHMPSAIKEPDAKDAFAAGITLTRYLVRQIRLYFEIRRVNRAAGEPQPEQQPQA